MEVIPLFISQGTKLRLLCIGRICKDWKKGEPGVCNIYLLRKLLQVNTFPAAMNSLLKGIYQACPLCV